MNARDFIDAYGRDEARRVAARAGTNYAYFSQIAYGHRRPSPQLAERLEAASAGRMDFVSLLKVRKNLAA